MNEHSISAISALENAFNQASGDFDKIQEIFLEHAESDFIELYIKDALTALTGSDRANPVGLVSKIGAYFINNETFDYSLRVFGPRINTENVKWLGVGQIWVVKGAGKLHVRVLQLPQDIDINHFQKDIECSIAEERVLGQGDSIACRGPFRIIEIIEVDSPLLLESLTIKDKCAELYWNFDDNNKSSYSEFSSSYMSRIDNIINLSNRMNYPIPLKLIDEIYRNGDSNIKIKVIEKLLLEENHVAFNYLEQAVGSGNIALSRSGQKILSGY